MTHIVSSVSVVGVLLRSAIEMRQELYWFPILILVILNRIHSLFLTTLLPFWRYYCITITSTIITSFNSSLNQKVLQLLFLHLNCFFDYYNWWRKLPTNPFLVYSPYLYSCYRSVIALLLLTKTKPVVFQWVYK